MSKEAMKMALDTLWKSFNVEATRGDLLSAIEALRTALAQPEPMDMEAMAESVHDAYLTTCDALGWGVKPENRVPYSELTEDSKELDRASVRAVLRYTAPLQREWVGLPNDEVLERANKFRDPETYLRGVLWAEAKLKEKNSA